MTRKTSKNWLQGIHLSASSPGRSRRRVAVTLVASLVGVALTWAGFRFVHDRNESSNQLKFQQEAERIASDMETSFNLSLEHLRSIPAFLAAADEVSFESFQTFVSPTLDRNAALYVSCFLPRIAPDQIAEFESAAQAEGFHDCRVRTVDTDGSEVALARHDTYFPIYFTKPVVPEVLGIDLGSHPEQAQYIQAASRTSEPVVTPPLSLIEDPEDVLSVIAFVAVPEVKLKHFGESHSIAQRSPSSSARDGNPTRQRGAQTPTFNNSTTRLADASGYEKAATCAGIAQVILKVRPLAEVSLGSKSLEEFRVLLRDTDAVEARQLVYKNFPGQADSILRAGWPAVEREVQFADQTWTLTIVPAEGSGFAPSTPPYWILIVGTILSLLLAYSLSATLTIEKLKQQVDQAMQLGQYRLGAKLGEGGMGAVYEASHEMLARPAAIKLIRTDNSEMTRRWQSRFEREAQATASLQSPHTVSIYDFGKTTDGTFYYVMERLDGVDLATLVETEGPLSPTRVVHLLRQVCHSLAEAHASGLIHRDIKPANIFVCRHALEQDFVKVLDFGLVKANEREPSVELTQAGTLLGTPTYMAPEMIQDQAADARSDLYSLGCVAFFMLTGRTVFDGSLSAIIAGHVKKEPPKMHTPDGTAIPSELEQIVLQCLAKNPSERPADAIELEQQLAALPYIDWETGDGQIRHSMSEPNGDSQRSLEKTKLLENG